MLFLLSEMLLYAFLDVRRSNERAMLGMLANPVASRHNGILRHG